MRTIVAPIATFSLLFAASAFAQSDSSPRSTTAPPAVSNPSNAEKTTAAPVPGKNSFTPGEVTKRLNDHGYSDISNLSKDDQSIWHATATKSGQQVNVAVDYQGNITETR